MKRLLIVMLAFAALLAAQGPSNCSGIWNGKGAVADAKYGHLPVTAQLTLIQAGNSLQGTFKAGNGKPVALSGSVSGNQIVFSVGGGKFTANLTQNGNQLAGTMTANTGQVAHIVFTLLRQ